MEFSQSIRKAGSSLKRQWFIGLDRLAAAKPEDVIRWLYRSSLFLFTGIIFYYVIGMIAVHKIDDNLNFKIEDESLTANQSRSVAIVASLIKREVKDHQWVANDPFFYPTSLLDNMTNYQLGMIEAFSRFGIALTDHLSRTRGASEGNTNLENARGSLVYSPTRWRWDNSIIPTTPVEDEYMKAHDLLLKYNSELANGTAIFDRRSDNLLATLDGIASEIGASSGTLQKRIAKHGFLIDAIADDEFYKIKGRLYGYYMILRELKKDFANVIEEKRLGKLYDDMLEDLEDGAKLDPFAVMNMSPDGLAWPNHLAAQGFYLLRARTQLREITDSLLK